MLCCFGKYPVEAIAKSKALAFGMSDKYLTLVALSIMLADVPARYRNETSTRILYHIQNKIEVTDQLSV